MSHQNITREVQICDKCGTAFDPVEGDVCKCPAPMVLPNEEPIVDDWGDGHAES